MCYSSDPVHITKQSAATHICYWNRLLSVCHSLKQMEYFYSRNERRPYPKSETHVVTISKERKRGREFLASGRVCAVPTLGKLLLQKMSKEKKALLCTHQSEEEFSESSLNKGLLLFSRNCIVVPFRKHFLNPRLAFVFRRTLLLFSSAQPISRPHFCPDDDENDDDDDAPHTTTTKKGPPKTCY